MMGLEPYSDPSDSDSESSTSNSSSDSESSNNSSDTESCGDSSDSDSSPDSPVDVKVQSSINTDEPAASSITSAPVKPSIDIDEEKVQYLSIQWLNLERVFFHFDIKGEARNTFEFQNIIDMMINKHNEVITKRDEKKRGKKKVGFYLGRSEERKLDGNVYRKLVGSVDREPHGSDDKNVYSLVWYVHTKTGKSPLSRMSERSPKKRRNFDYIIFIYQKDTKRFISLTTGNAFNVVRPYVNFDFPIKVSERIADIKKIIKLKRRCLFGSKLQEEILNPTENLCYLTSNLYYYIDSFTCDVKTDSDFFKLINMLIQGIIQEEIKELETKDLVETEKNKKIVKFEQKKKKISERCWITVRTGGIIRIGKKLFINDYLLILDELAKYLEDGNQTEMDFEFLNFLRPVKYPHNLQLNNSLMKWIYENEIETSSLQCLHVRHKLLEDFLLSDSFGIGVYSKNWKFDANPPNIEEIKEIIYGFPKAKTDFSEFVKIFKKCRFTFIDQATGKSSIPEKLIDCIEGEHRLGGIMYFKIRKMWYELTSNYFTLLNEDVKNVIVNSLIPKDSPWRLDKIWIESMEEEKEYNQLYAGDAGVLVFDTVTPYGIELCDILKYNPNNSNEPLYLYQVKKKFDHDMRVAASQLWNAAKLIKSVTATNKAPNSRNYLEKLYDEFMPTEKFEGWKKKVSLQLSALGKKAFVDLFFKRTIVFVLAIIRPGKECLFSKALIEIDKGIEKEIIEKLKSDEYLDQHERLTGKFNDVTKEEFNKKYKTTKNEDIFEKLHARRFYSKSTAAKLELIQLSQNLQNYNFKFEICEITSDIFKSKKCKRKTEPIPKPGPAPKTRVSKPKSALSKRKKNNEIITEGA